MRTQIGTVRITRRRIYKLDPRVPDALALTTVVVEPGEFPVFDDGDTRYWQMRGFLNRDWADIGDGRMQSIGGDDPSEDEVVFYSRRFGPDEWADLLDSSRREPDPRLVFTLLNAEGARP